MPSPPLATSSDSSPESKTERAGKGRVTSRSSATRATRKHKQRMHLPLPWSKGGSKGMYYYGYAVDEAWLLEFARKCDPNDQEITVNGAMIDILVALRDRTKIKSLYYEHGIVDPAKPISFAPSRIHAGNIPDVLLFSLCSTKRLSYDKRPTQAQVDLFERLTGLHERRWWKDAEPLYPQRKFTL